jgi:hypothetical protein
LLGYPIPKFDKVGIKMKNRFSVLVHCCYLVLFCLAVSSCSKLSQRSVQRLNQEDICELLINTWLEVM